MGSIREFALSVPLQEIPTSSGVSMQKSVGSSQGHVDNTVPTDGKSTSNSTANDAGIPKPSANNESTTNANSIPCEDITGETGSSSNPAQARIAKVLRRLGINIQLQVDAAARELCQVPGATLDTNTANAQNAEVPPSQKGGSVPTLSAVDRRAIHLLEKNGLFDVSAAFKKSRMERRVEPPKRDVGPSTILPALLTEQDDTNTLISGQLASLSVEGRGKEHIYLDPNGIRPGHSEPKKNHDTASKNGRQQHEFVFPSVEDANEEPSGPGPAKYPRVAPPTSANSAKLPTLDFARQTTLPQPKNEENVNVPQHIPSYPPSTGIDTSDFPTF